MRAFIVLCFVALACGQPGYNYRPFQSGNIGVKSNNVGKRNTSKSLTGLASYNRVPVVQYQKEFYSFRAPEEAFDDVDAANKIAAHLKKKIRVIFIKTPENKGYENAVLALAKQASEQKTAIYVLHKQIDIEDLSNKLNAARNNRNQKPEVHFVKYRTPEDAVNAQRVIQSQYDSSGGSSQIHDGGIASTLNFASQRPALNPTVQDPQPSYLPASLLRNLRQK